MPDDHALRNMAEAEQDEFAELLRGLTPEQWDAPSLCRGWSVHDTVIHIAIHSHTRPSQRFAQFARAGFSDDRQMEPERARSTDDLIDWLASPPTLGEQFDILTQLSELVIHQQDVRRPLGISRTIPPERLAVVLDFGVSRRGKTWTMAFSRRRSKGLRLRATDCDWWSGVGPEVRGPGEAILMALNGRGDALKDLEGEGTRVLASRIKP
jgi:uncharacterized protein (TIGR03083 family)